MVFQQVPMNLLWVYVIARCLAIVFHSYKQILCSLINSIPSEVALLEYTCLDLQMNTVL